MFENLESIFNNQKNLMRQKLENNIYEITLSSSFKKIMEAHYSTDVNLKVGEFTSKFVNNRNQTVFFPNSWFYIAYLSVPFYREFNIYREFVSGWFKDNKKFESFCTNAKSGNMDYNVFNQQTVHLQASEKANVEKFLTDYNWWKGAKSIDRGDSVNSPLLQLYPLIASSSEFVAILTKGISDEISNLDPDRDFTFVDLKNDSSNYDPIISSSIYIKELVNETNHAGKLDEFVTELERKRERFLDKFSISDLKQLTTDELFGKKENNSLAYNLCDNPEYRCFGSAKQGNTTPVNWSKEDFIEFLEEVDSYIQQNTFDSIGDYSNFITFIESKGPYFERIWVQKYLFILYPEIFVSQFKENIQRDVLNAFSIIPEKTNSGRIYQLSKLSSLSKVPSEYFYEIISLKNKINSFAETISCNKLQKTIQEIHFGAPGTGKSFGIAKILKTSYPDYQEGDDNPFVYRTTIHSEYTYYDFIGSIMPSMYGDEVGYDFSPGIFTKALEKANQFPDNDIFLIIEEMSRGNIAAIFGDIFQLLDRNSDGISEYQIDNAQIASYLIKRSAKSEKNDKISIPSNLHIIGTVNTSDQNVNVIDTAFKRRFDFIYESVSPAYDDSGKILNTFTFNLGNTEFEWNRFYLSLNEYIVNRLGLSDDKQLGQFFVKVNNNTDTFNIVRNKVLHYLWEDIQGASLKNIKLFNDNIKSFTKLYNEFTKDAEPKNIFSDDFLKVYETQKIEYEKQNDLSNSAISPSDPSQIINESESSTEVITSSESNSTD